MEQQLDDAIYTLRNQAEVNKANGQLVMVIGGW